MNLNAMQKAAVCHKDGPCLVVAGPGSGKTAVLTLRVGELIKSGVPAQQILVITFTKAAAIEMKERFNRLWDNSPVTFGTFHSLFWGILQKERGYKSSDIISGNARTRLLKEAMEKAGIETDDANIFNTYSAELSAYCNKSFGEKYVSKYVETENLVKLFNSYEALKAKYKVVDFDDMLLKAHQLLVNQPEILKKWQNRFTYFLVDEMQDMNSLQFELIRMLSVGTDNLFCVGDDDQSIYGFRGSDPGIMRDFMEIYPRAQKIILDVNYRNPKNLVKAAGSLMTFNENRFEKEIKATADDGEIKVTMYQGSEEEAKGIVLKVKALSQEGKPLEDMAILYRNHSDVRFVINELIHQKVPFYLKDKMPNIYSHFIIQDIECYFQIAIGNGTRARLLRILNRPNRYLHRRSVETTGLHGMLDFYKDNPGARRTVEALMADIKLISKMTPFAAINYIRKAMGYEGFLKLESMEKHDDFLENKRVLDFLLEVVKDCKTINQAIDKISYMRLKVDFDNKNKENTKDGKVGLYTLHSSKGLEFENVFIIQANEGIIPTNKVESTEDLESERRLFYVGITRCKRNLYISYNKKINRDKSRFIDELKLDYSSPSSS